MTTITCKISFGAYAGTAYYHEHRWWMAPKPVCDFLGLAWRVQRRVIQASDGLSVRTLKVRADDGKNYESVVVATDDIGVWLIQISASKVNEAAREPLREMKHNLRAAIAEQVNAAFGIPSPADLEALINAPVTAHLDAAAIIQLRTEVLTEPGVARAGQLFAMGLPGTKVGLLLGRSAYWARKQRGKLEALGSLQPRWHSRLAEADVNQLDMFGGGTGHAR